MNTNLRAVIAMAFASSATLTASGARATVYPSIIAVNSDGSAYVEELSPSSETCSPILGPASVGVGTIGTYATDLDFDGLTDIVAWFPQFVVAFYGQSAAGGQAFFGPQTWVSNVSFYGTKANTIGDVNGDHIQDLIAWNSNNVYVEFGSANRGTYSAPTLFYSGAFYGNVANVMADVNNDGKQDLVAWNSDSIYYVPSEGAFGGTEGRTGFCQPFYGSIANLSGDVPNPLGGGNNRQGAPDFLIAWNSNSIFALDGWYQNGCNPGNPVGLSYGSFYGSVANLVLDVNMDGDNDVVAVNSNNTYVELFDTHPAYSSPVQWCSDGAFYGNVATFAGYTAR